MNKDYSKASDIISRFFVGIQNDGFIQANSFLRTWNTIVGDKIAAHSRVIDVDKGMLIIEVDHSGWSQQILFLKKRIISVLNSQYKEFEIKNLLIRVSSECPTPYQRQETIVGEGIVRIEVPQTPVVIDTTLDEPLKNVLEKLKKSIENKKY